MKPSTSLHQPFLDSQTFATGRAARPSRPARKHPFLWAFITTLNLFIAVAVWAGIATMIAQPERPFCYDLLGKLGKREELSVFDASNAPKNDHQTGQVLASRYGSFNESQLDALNQELLRGYITNYDNSAPVPMVEGEFELIGARALRENDLMDSGLILLARSTEQASSGVLLEYLLPTSMDSSPDIKALGLTPGSGADIPPLSLQRNQQFAAITHIEKLPNNEILFSVVPLSYESPSFANGQTLTLTPPQSLNIESSMPVLDTSELISEEAPAAVASAH